MPSIGEVPGWASSILRATRHNGPTRLPSRVDSREKEKEDEEGIIPVVMQRIPSWWNNPPCCNPCYGGVKQKNPLSR